MCWAPASHECRKRHQMTAVSASHALCPCPATAVTLAALSNTYLHNRRNSACEDENQSHAGAQFPLFRAKLTIPLFPPPCLIPEFGVYCSHCRSEVRGTQCAICKGFTFQCAVCHVAVRGSSNFCLTCGHGGHTSHMMEWFRTQEVCPTGCGCHCLLESTF